MIEYSLLLDCGHEYRTKMHPHTAIYRRQWLQVLPMQARCNACRKPREVTKIYHNAAEQPYEQAQEAGA